MKSEPETYSWADLVRDGKTDWTGVRNFAARGHLKAMQVGDRAFFYHSGEQKAIVGLAEITRTSFPDKTAEEEGWVAVEVKAVEPLARPVTLAEIKKEPTLAEMALIRLSRLSVQPVAKPEFEKILKMAKA
jgi:predicted RNA-binding protein with PUA-like domain